MALTCRHIRQLHHPFLDGDLSSGMMAEVHAHLLQCPACQDEIEMLRACGDVIARDTSAEPELDSGFAQRVVAALPRTNASAGLSLETRRARRQRFWRMAAGGSLPAAAAVLFFAVLIWPTQDPVSRQTEVLGESVVAPAVEDMLDPTRDALAETQRSMHTLNKLLELPVQATGDDLRRGLDNMADAAPEDATDEAISIMDILLPFDRLIETPAKSGDSADDGIVRM